jgi:hypothetical protein
VHRQRLNHVQYNVFRSSAGCSVVSRLVQSSAGCSVGEMSAQELGHAKGLDPLAAEDWLHQLVRSEPLLVLGVLEILLLEVGPEPLDDLAPGQLLVQWWARFIKRID